MTFDSEQERLREIADIIAKANFDGFVPQSVVNCYAIAYDGLQDKRGFPEPHRECVSRKYGGKNP